MPIRVKVLEQKSISMSVTHEHMIYEDPTGCYAVQASKIMTNVQQVMFRYSTKTN